MIFPDIGFMIVNGKDSLGFSIECQADKTHDGTQDEFLYIDKFTGTACALLWKNTAAFSTTYIKELVASLQNKQVKEVDNMNEEQMKTLLESILGGLKDEFNAKVDEIKSSVEEKVSTLESKVETVVSEVKAEVDKANGSVEALAEGFAETKETIKAMSEKQISASVEPAPVVPAPAVVPAGAAIVANSDVTPPSDDKKQKIAEINASNMTMVEKIKAINALK
jgi:outer membrane murein-binding lipoprotein Lpp